MTSSFPFRVNGPDVHESQYPDGPLPPLEVAIRIAQLGGWENVEVVSRVDKRGGLAWQNIPRLSYWESYCRPHETPDPDIWDVFDARAIPTNEGT